MTPSGNNPAALPPGEAQPAGRGLFSGRSLPWCIAHRGFSANRPENTLPAFLAAADAGADMVELDVTFSFDRWLTVIHDDTLDRTTDGRGPVSAMPFSRIKNLDAGSWFGKEFSGTRVPDLEEVFSAVANRLAVNVEIKAAREEETTLELARASAALVREKGLVSRVLFSSFNEQALAAVREALPDACIGVLADKPESPDKALGRVEAFGAAAYHPNARHLTPALVTRLHGKGVKVLAWASAADNHQKMMEQVLLAGADGFFANNPGLFLQVREKVCGRARA